MIVNIMTVFVCSLIADAVYGAYTLSLSRGNMSVAMTASALFSVIRTGMTIMCVEDWRLVPAAVVGESIGTLLVILFDRRMKQQRAEKPISSDKTREFQTAFVADVTPSYA
jgi:hypothetical protein